MDNIKQKNQLMDRNNFDKRYNQADGPHDVTAVLDNELCQVEESVDGQE
jgi:hypothetical protein